MILFKKLFKSIDKKRQINAIFLIIAMTLSSITELISIALFAPFISIILRNEDVQNGKIFAENGMQIAAGVPLECGEGSDFKTFRLGLFGLDKLKNPDRTISNFKDVLEKIC